MFDPIFSSTTIPSSIQYLIMISVALISGLLFSWILSFKVKSTKRFFIVNAILPATVGTILSFVNGNIGVGVAIGGAFALVRFRSAPGSADEMASIFITMASGVAFGMGYLAYGALILIILAVVYVIMTYLPIFEHKNKVDDRMLKITIPESLDYTDVFNNTFEKYLDSYESIGVKTTDMGSMFRLSFKIRMKNDINEKALIDELRILNGNLEIQILPYKTETNVL